MRGAVERNRWRPVPAAASAGAAVALLLAFGCRDAPDPFQAQQPVFRTDEPLWQLTYNVRNDRSPTWSSDGDSVYYVAEGYGHLPASPGLIMAAPRDGGVAVPIMRDVQVEGSPRWLATPAVSPSADRLVFAEIWGLWQPPVCPSDDERCDGEAEVDPRLRTVFLRARDFDGTGPLNTWPERRVEFAGHEFDTSEVPPGIIGTPGIYRSRMHPFQRLWGDGFIFRPSWAPDGERVVFSDGLQLLVWEVDGTGEPVAIPGTEDGVWPAWSPNGDWIAFTRLERGDSIKVRCECWIPLDDPTERGLFQVQERTVYTGTATTLTLIRPDGSEVRELGPGEEPAWAPDSQTLYFRHEDRIWRVSASGGSPVQVPNTARGREPAVSPDGAYLAFTRRNNRGIHKIWILELEP